ncbi:hypothetical protein GEV29_15550 [Aeromicrobium sp. SMF47]|uniref:sigma factor n=1 Tax=Aeromicrobium TaxID=2040 RepID=UPI00129D5454|nr:MULTISPECIES: sigma factor [Aeromicrobium]MRJ77954.1 hypothetical protein [Aeromicrobium yanjiei]MRK02314.1 hypothetical protein [Aeromicrobium sp. S22]
MDRFVRELLSLPSLDAEQERALAVRAGEGDRDARADLITAGLRLVALRACLLGLTGEDMRDAVQAGAVGLIRAVDRFDPDRGARLATYAWHWIGAEMSVARPRDVPLGEVDPPYAEPDVLGDSLLDGLSDDAVAVLSLRFGLGPGGGSPMPRIAVAQRLGVSVTRIRTIEGEAMRQLREGLAKVVDRAPLQREADPP